MRTSMMHGRLPPDHLTAPFWRATSAEAWRQVRRRFAWPVAALTALGAFIAADVALGGNETTRLWRALYVATATGAASVGAQYAAAFIRAMLDALDGLVPPSGEERRN